MTARSSTGNFSKFGTYFLYKLRTLRPLIILTSIFSLLSYPMLFGFTVAMMHADCALDKYNDAHPLLVQNGSIYDDAGYIKLRDTVDLLNGLTIMALIIGIIMLAAIFFMSFVVTRKNFRWLYNKTIVDMDYSLPISDDTRFFGDLLSTTAATLVPHSLAIILGRIILMFRPKEYEEVEEVLDVGLFSQVTVSGLFACVMFMAFVLFIIAICGRKAETNLYPLVITVAVPIIHAVCLWLAYSDVYGYQFASSPNDFNSLSYTSPLGFIFMSFLCSVDFSGDIEEFALPLFRVAYGIPAIVLTVALFVAAYFLIKNRRAERVGQPFVFNVVKFIIPAIITFTIVSPFMGIIGELMEEAKEYSYTTHYEGFIIAMIIITFVVYVVMELISGKGFRRFHITLVKYLATMGISVLICVGLWNAHGFGIANYVPDAEKVQSVEFTLRNYNVNNSRFRSQVSELENIRAITEVHEALPKEKQTDSTDRYISLTYNMKNGETVEREYYLTRTQYNEWMDAVLTAEAYYYNTINDWLYDWDGDEVITSIEDENTGYAYNSLKIDGEDFIEAIRNDCYSASFDELYGATVSYTHELYIQYKNPNGYSRNAYINIRDWMTETLALLAENGVYIFSDNNAQVDYSKYKTAFLVEHDSSNIGYFDPAVAYMMCGDDTLTDDMLKNYGYAKDIVQMSSLTEEECEMYGVIYEGGYGSTIAYDPQNDKEICIVDFSCKMLDTNSPEFREAMTWCVENVAISYNQEKLYSIYLLTSENIYEYLQFRGNDELQYFVTDNCYDEAAELFAKLPA